MKTYLELTEMQSGRRFAIPLSPLPLVMSTDTDGISNIYHSGHIISVEMGYDELMYHIKTSILDQELCVPPPPQSVDNSVASPEQVKESFETVVS